MFPKYDIAVSSTFSFSHSLSIKVTTRIQITEITNSMSVTTTLHILQRAQLEQNYMSRKQKHSNRLIYDTFWFRFTVYVTNNSNLVQVIINYVSSHILSYREVYEYRFRQVSIVMTSVATNASPPKVIPIMVITYL